MLWIEMCPMCGSPAYINYELMHDIRNGYCTACGYTRYGNIYDEDADEEEADEETTVIEDNAPSNGLKLPDDLSSARIMQEY